MAGPTTPKERFQFIYNGVEYDATEYAEKHPGGLNFLQNMKQVTKDFTEYFRALHSDAALKILKSFPIISIGKPSTSSEQYMQIYKKVQKYNEPLWIMEILLFLLVATTWFVGCTTQYSWLSIISFSFSMILVGWIGHSAIHNRNPILKKAVKFASTGFGGFSVDWWNNKHNMHHMFTNIVKYDQDIQHQYKIYLFEFLYLKWRFDSLVYAIKDKNLVDLGLLAFNYGTLVYWHENALYFLAAALLSGFYSAIILVGNHQNQKRFEENPNMPFMDHQICTSRNYREENFFWLLLMGGMQYQAEHHMFPQIPFYRLPNAKIVIKNELAKLNKSLIYGPIR